MIYKNNLIYSDASYTSDTAKISDSALLYANCRWVSTSTNPVKNNGSNISNLPSYIRVLNPDIYLSDDAVHTSQIADSAVTNSKIASASITYDKFISNLFSSRFSVSDQTSGGTTFKQISIPTAASSTYGVTRLSDSTSSTSGVSGGYAATPAAVRTAYNLADSKQNTLTATNGITINGDNIGLTDVHFQEYYNSSATNITQNPNIDNILTPGTYGIRIVVDGGEGSEIVARGTWPDTINKSELVAFSLVVSRSIKVNDNGSYVPIQTLYETRTNSGDRGTLIWTRHIHSIGTPKYTADDATTSNTWSPWVPVTMRGVLYTNVSTNTIDTCTDIGYYGFRGTVNYNSNSLGGTWPSDISSSTVRLYGLHVLYAGKNGNVPSKFDNDRLVQVLFETVVNTDRTNTDTRMWFRSSLEEITKSGTTTTNVEFSWTSWYRVITSNELGNSTSHGIVKLSDATNDTTNGASSNIAATPKAVGTVYSTLSTEINKKQNSLTAENGITISSNKIGLSDVYYMDYYNTSTTQPTNNPNIDNMINSGIYTITINPEVGRGTWPNLPGNSPNAIRTFTMVVTKTKIASTNTYGAIQTLYQTGIIDPSSNARSHVAGGLYVWTRSLISGSNTYGVNDSTTNNSWRAWTINNNMGIYHSGSDMADIDKITDLGFHALIGSISDTTLQGTWPDDLESAAKSSSRSYGLFVMYAGNNSSTPGITRVAQLLIKTTPNSTRTVRPKMWYRVSLENTINDGRAYEHGWTSWQRLISSEDIASASNAGIVTLSDSASTANAASGTAASPAAIKDGKLKLKISDSGTATDIFSANQSSDSTATIPTGSNTTFGVLKLSDSTDTTSGQSAGIAATPTAVKSVKNSIKDTTITVTAGGGSWTGNSFTTNTSTATTIDIPKGNSSTFGVVKLSDSASSTNTASKNIAASPAAIKDAKLKLKISDSGTATDIFSANQSSDNTATIPTGSSSAFGVVKLSDSTSTTSGINDGIAATPTAVKSVKNSIKDTTITVTAGGGSWTGNSFTTNTSTATTIDIPKGNYTTLGVVKLSDTTNSTSGVNNGYAATPAAVKIAYDLADSKQNALTAENGITISDDNKIGLTDVFFKEYFDVDASPNIDDIVTPGEYGIRANPSKFNGTWPDSPATATASYRLSVTRSEKSTSSGNPIIIQEMYYTPTNVNRGPIIWIRNLLSYGSGAGNRSWSNWVPVTSRGTLFKASSGINIDEIEDIGYYALTGTVNQTSGSLRLAGTWPEDATTGYETLFGLHVLYGGKATVSGVTNNLNRIIQVLVRTTRNGNRDLAPRMWFRTSLEDVTYDDGGTATGTTRSWGGWRRIMTSDNLSTASVFGIVKLSDSTSDSTSDNSSSIAATPKAVATVANSIKDAKLSLKIGSNSTATQIFTANQSSDNTVTIPTGTNSALGVVKLSDSTSTTSGQTAGIAATPTAVKAAYELANGKQDPLTASKGITISNNTAIQLSHTIINDDVDLNSVTESGIYFSNFKYSDNGVNYKTRNRPTDNVWVMNVMRAPMSSSSSTTRDRCVQVLYETDIGGTNASAVPERVWDRGWKRTGMSTSTSSNSLSFTGSDAYWTPWVKISNPIIPIFPEAKYGKLLSSIGWDFEPDEWIEFSSRHNTDASLSTKFDDLPVGFPTVNPSTSTSAGVYYDSYINYTFRVRKVESKFTSTSNITYLHQELTMHRHGTTAEAYYNGAAQELHVTWKRTCSSRSDLTDSPTGGDGNTSTMVYGNHTGNWHSDDVIPIYYLSSNTTIKLSALSALDYLIEPGAISSYKWFTILPTTTYTWTNSNGLSSTTVESPTLSSPATRKGNIYLCQITLTDGSKILTKPYLSMG